MACLHAKVDKEVVKIGPIAVREDYQATFFFFYLFNSLDYFYYRILN